MSGCRGITLPEPTEADVEEALSGSEADKMKKFFSDIDGDAKDAREAKRKKGKVAKIRKKSHPSFRYIDWKNKHNIEIWKEKDLIGYYLHEFKKVYDREDPDFKVARNKVPTKLLEKQKRDSKSLTGAERKVIEESRKNIWSKILLQIGNFLKHTFDGDKSELHEYLRWLFNYIESDEADWYDGSLSALTVFRDRKNPFLKKYIGTKRKTKKKKRGKFGEGDWDKRHR
jgi:hypothetical protein